MDKLLPDTATPSITSAVDLFIAQANSSELHLDDSVTVMRNKIVSSPSNEVSLTIKELQIFDARKIQEALFAVQDSQNLETPSNSTPNRN